MCVTPSWEDIGGLWESGNPPVPPNAVPTWEQDACNVGYATETFVIRDETVGAGFLYDGAVEEFTNFTDDAVHPFVNNWDTCEDPLTDFWVEEDPFDGTPGDCDEE